MNPFVTAMNSSISALVDRQGLQIQYNLPQGQPARYYFKDPPKIPVPVIMLPKINVTRLDSEQKRTLNALLFHELTHHIQSTLKERKESNEHSTFVGDLFNYLEDARNEITEIPGTVGCKQDLVHYRTKKIKEINAEANIAITNPWGWIFQAYKYMLPGYGSVIIPEELKEYFEIGMEVLNKNDRFKKSCKTGLAGCKMVLQLAIEMHDAWQQKRDKEQEQEDGQGNQSDEGDQSDEGKQGESSNEDRKDSNEQNDSKDSNGNSSSHPNGDSMEPSNDNDGDQPSDSSEDSESSDSGKDSQSGKEQRNPDSENQDNGGKSDRGKQSKNDSERNNKKTQSGNNSDENEEERRDEKNSGGKGSGGDNNPSDNSERGQSDNGKDAEGSGDKDTKKPRSIQEEYDNAQGNPNTEIKPDTLGIEVAALINDPNQSPDWELKESKENKNNLLPDFPGDPYIPYSKEDQERIAKPNPKEFFKIESEISLQAIALRSHLTRILTTKSLTVTERNLRQGTLDPQQFHKILSGSKYVKKEITPGIKLDTAVTLLIDLSGSMMGEKAEMAVKVATVFGEALKGIPQIPFEILGYNSSPLSISKFGLEGFVRKEAINYWIFKTFEEPWRIVRERMGSATIDMSKDGAAGGCNCDHENLLHAAARLYARREPNKVMIVICDGAPSGYNGTYNGHLPIELKRTVNRIRKAEISIFCFGIKSEKVRIFYDPDVEILDSIEDLDKKALSKLSGFLLRRRGKKRS